VVFLTGYGFTAHENLAFETGAVDRLLGPFALRRNHGAT
jgi:hypothetical protein